jgi:hypothetical protein
VDLNFTKGKGVYLEAVSEKPIALDAVLKILFPGDISTAVVIPAFIVLPAMTVTYRSSTGKFSVRSQKEESSGGGKGVHAHPATAVSPLPSKLPQPLLEPQERRRSALSSCARITGAPNLSDWLINLINVASHSGVKILDVTVADWKIDMTLTSIDVWGDKQESTPSKTSAYVGLGSARLA